MQRLMDSILAGLKWQSCLVYLDDIIVFSPTFEQHLKDLTSVLQRLQHAHLTVNLRKCKFACDEVHYLGYRITPTGLSTDLLRFLLSPTSRSLPIKTLRSFIGLCGYYRSFIARFSQIAAPLHALLAKDATWSWAALHQFFFGSLKTSLVSAPVLRFPDFTSPFELHTDGACSTGIGFILSQRDPTSNKFHAIALASRSLSHVRVRVIEDNRGR